jgi:hypothetical protein
MTSRVWEPETPWGKTSTSRPPDIHLPKAFILHISGREHVGHARTADTIVKRVARGSDAP